MKLCSYKHRDVEEIKTKRGNGKGNKIRKRKEWPTSSPQKKAKHKTNNNNSKKKTQPSSIYNLVWPDSQIENLGQNTGDLPPRTRADYSTLHFKKRKGRGCFSEVQMSIELQ